MRNIDKYKKEFDFVPLISDKIYSPYIKASIYEQEEAEKNKGLFKKLFG